MSSHCFNPQFELMNRENLNAYQSEHLCKIVRYVVENSSFFRNRYENAGIDVNTFNGLEDLEKLPFMTKADFREQYPDKMCCVPRDKIVEMHMSSGSSGVPVVMLYTKEDIEQWSECLARNFTMTGIKAGDVMQATPGFGLFTAGFGDLYGARKLGLFMIPTGPGNTARQIKLAKDFKTKILDGVVSYAARLVEVLKETNQTLPDLKMGIFGAEMLTDEMRRYLEKGLNIEVYVDYGLVEVGGKGTAIECCAHNGLHIWEDHFIAEIINPQTGQVVPDGQMGELVLTTLHREALPVIRYRTGDLTRIISRDTCSCGRTHIRIENIAGRLDDMMIINGVNCFPSQIENVLMKTVGSLPNYQIIIDERHALKKLSVKIEETPNINLDEIKCALRDELGFSINIETCPTNSLNLYEGNKAKRVIHLRTESK